MAKPIAQLIQETSLPNGSGTNSGGTGSSGGSTEPTGPITNFASFIEESEVSNQPVFGNIPLDENSQPAGDTPPTGTPGTSADATNGDATPPEDDTNLEAGETDTAEKNSDEGLNPAAEPEETPDFNSDIANDSSAISDATDAKKDASFTIANNNPSTALTGCERMDKLFNNKLAAVKLNYKLADDSDNLASKDLATKLIDPSSKSECFKINTGKIEHFGENILDDACQTAAGIYAAFVHLFPPKSLDTFSFYTEKNLTSFEPGNSKFFQALDEKQNGISLKQVCTNKFQGIKEHYEYVNDANEKTSKDTATKIINNKSKSECFKMDQGKIIAFGEKVLDSSCREISYFYAANIYSSEDTKDLSEFMVDSPFDLTPYEIENTEFINALNIQ